MKNKIESPKTATYRKLAGVATVLEWIAPQEEDPELRAAALAFAVGLRGIAGEGKVAGLRSECRKRGSREVVREIAKGMSDPVRGRLLDKVHVFDVACRRTGM